MMAGEDCERGFGAEERWWSLRMGNGGLIGNLSMLVELLLTVQSLCIGECLPATVWDHNVGYCHESTKRILLCLRSQMRSFVVCGLDQRLMLDVSRNAKDMQASWHM